MLSRIGLQSKVKRCKRSNATGVTCKTLHQAFVSHRQTLLSPRVATPVKASQALNGFSFKLEGKKMVPKILDASYCGSENHF